MILDNVRAQPNIVPRKMIASHEYERLRQLLRSRLTDCGWRDQVTQRCKQIIAENDIDTLSVDDIIDRVTPQARSMVPATVKKELLQKIKNHLMEETSLFPRQRIEPE